MTKNVTEAISRGVKWLLAQQSKSDGGWHSETYGAMRGGASSTSLALYTASHLPSDYRIVAEWKRGFEFLVPGITKRNCIACPDGTLDYPTYSTAMTLIASRRLKSEAITPANRRRLVDYLVSAQLQESNGFTPDQVDYGGWDLIGASGARGITSGTNISVSYFAVAALSEESHARKTETLTRAIDWCKRCQNWPLPDGDGGFFFHPERNSLGNKAEWIEDDYERPRSYGTATCDGVSLLGSAAAGSDERLSAAVSWLRTRPATDKVPGFEKKEKSEQTDSDSELADEEFGWDVGLKYYFFLSLSRILPRLSENVRTKRKAELVAELLELQKKDGRWENRSAKMREDDPLIATCFSLVALSNLLSLT